MKGLIAGLCVSLVVLGAEMAAGIEMSLGVRLLIVVPLSALVGLLLEK